jgi:preprotein translocase subunit SecD
VKGRLRAKAAIILAITLACLYRITGLPRSKGELIANLHNNIHLGLDLSGGTQLVMEVQLQDAFKAFADSAIDRLKDELKGDNIAYASIDRNDPQDLADADKIEVEVRGIPGYKSGAFRSVVRDILFEWNLTSINSTDYRLTLTPSGALKLKHDTIARTMATIERKINALPG